MSKHLFCINFYGHDSPSLVGTKAWSGLGAQLGVHDITRNIRRTTTLNVISAARVLNLFVPQRHGQRFWCVDWNAGLALEDHYRVADKVYTDIVTNGFIGQQTEPRELFFIITGYSAGGISALYMAQYLSVPWSGAPRGNVLLLGLADAAFQRGETDFLMRVPGIIDPAAWKLNYFQVKENHPDIREVKGRIDGFENHMVKVTTPDDLIGIFQDSPHEQAIRAGNNAIFEKIGGVVQAFNSAVAFQALRSTPTEMPFFAGRPPSMRRFT